MLGDMGQGIPFRAGIFDGCISISAVQWLCNADKKSHSPPKRLYAFFKMLYASLRHGAKAVLQLYPETPDQMELIMYQATRAGFTGGVVVDYPNSAKAKKYYLCLFAGVSADQTQMPLGEFPRREGTIRLVEKNQNSRGSSRPIRTERAFFPFRRKLTILRHKIYSKNKSRISK